VKDILFMVLFIVLLSIPVSNIYSDNADNEPVPYEDDEFPVWAQKLRRAEIILFGSIPLTILLSYFTYKIIRFGIHDWESDYRPFGNPNSPDFTKREHIGVLITASSISLAIVIIDYAIGMAREKRSDNARENR
jgi:hypothetical protein